MLTDLAGPPAVPEMLTGHRLISTNDLDDARQKVAEVFCPHRLALTGRSTSLALRHNRYLLSDLALNYMDYGSEVHITPGVLHSFYLVQIPLSGGSEVRSGGATVQCDPRTAAVPNATDSLDMTWLPQSPHFVLYLSRESVERRLAEVAGRPAPIPVRFRLAMDLEDAGVRGWRELVDLLRRDADDPTVSLHPAVRRQVEDAVLTGLLHVQPHNLSGWLDKDASPAASRSVRAAMALCEESPERMHSVTDLAAHAGVSIRCLQEGFRRYLGLTPMEYLREVRLRRVREDLLGGQAHGGVADAAFAWGFTHLGRFSQHYRQRFGELPSETLRRVSQ